MRKFVVLLALCLVASGTGVGSAALPDRYDVVVAGGGMGGIAAAIQAARMGASVLVAEPSGCLGGQAVAAGVVTMDDMSQVDSGLYLEFLTKVKEYYAALGKSIGTCYWSSSFSRAFEPFVGQKVLLEMAETATGRAPEILFHSSVAAVKKEGRTVRGATLRTPEGEREVSCKILIDATEYGDVLPLAGARYRSGNGLSPDINPDARIQDITWTAVIRKYPGGVPDRLRPRTPLPGYERARENYRNYLTEDGADFEDVYPVRFPLIFPAFNGYRGLPDSLVSGDYTADRSDRPRITKTSVNLGNDYPGNYGWEGDLGLPAAYLEDPALRARVEREALIKTLHFIYYLQNDMGAAGAGWSVAEEEYGELPDAAKDLPEEWREVARHMPPVPYVRESRRALGETTLNSAALFHNSLSYHEGRGNHELPDAIAQGCYILDLHHATDDQDLEAELGERHSSMRDDAPASNFQVPMRILIPGGVDGLLAAEKNLSMSRLSSGALRLQPICMMTGQAAGALAALAAQRGVPPRQLHALPVQRALVEAGVALSLCRYEDVPPDHPLYGSVQLSNLYGLVRPRIYPSFPAYDIREPSFSEMQKCRAEGRFAGRFGVDEPMLRRDAEAMAAVAANALGLRASSPRLDEPERPITRREFAQLLFEALEIEITVDAADIPMTRGEAADGMIRAMEAFCLKNTF